MIKAVVFDLDGTITKPFLNFKKIRLEIGVAFGRQSLLDQIEDLSEDEEKEGFKILERHEREAAENSKLNKGVHELLEKVKEVGLHHAIVTRNSKTSTDVVIKKLGIEVERVVTRNDDIKIKPDPEALKIFADEWEIKTEEILMVGDFKYDIEFGRLVSAKTCLVTNGREVEDDWGADFVVDYPVDVIKVIESLLD